MVGTATSVGWVGAGMGQQRFALFNFIDGIKYISTGCIYFGEHINRPANSSVIPKSFSLFLVFSPRPVPPSDSAADGKGCNLAGSMISASTNALSSPCNARVDLDGASGRVGKGKEGSVARGVGDLRRLGFGETVRRDVSAMRSPDPSVAAGKDTWASSSSLRRFEGLLSSFCAGPAVFSANSSS